MAIASGLATGCTELQATGGIKNVFLRKWNSTGSPDKIATLSDSTMTITSIADNGGTNSTWGVYEAKLGTASLTVNGTSEIGVNTYECVLSFYIPKLSLTLLDRIHELGSQACLMAMVQDTNDLYYVIGVSNVLTGGDGGLDPPVSSHIGTRPQTFARLGSIEGGTGGAFSDEDGYTVNIVCTQYELPRNYIAAGSAPSIDSTGLIATIT